MAGTAFPAAVTPYLPLIVVHIAGGVIAIVAGFVAVLAPKGERIHRIAGTVFLAAMLTMATMATYLAIRLLDVLPGQSPNIAAGILAPYLVLTGWMAIRRKQGTGIFERLALVAVLGLSAVFFYWGIMASMSPTGTLNGYAPVFFYVFGGGAGGVRHLRPEGHRHAAASTGAARIARHLWRMCFGFFFATGSFFLGQQKVMPAFMHGAWYLFVLALAPLGFMIFWLVRVRIGTRFKGRRRRLRRRSTSQGHRRNRIRALFGRMKSAPVSRRRSLPGS